MKIVRTAILAVVLVIAALPAFAQQGPMGGPYDEERGFDNPERGGPSGVAPRERREEVHKKIEAVRMWRLTEELKLDEKTSTKVAAFLSAMEEKRRALMQEQGENMRSLRMLLQASTPDERKLKAKLETLEKNHHAMMELRDKEANGIKDMLTVEQQARYLIFQQEFRREMSDMIAGARGGGPGLRGPGGGRAGTGPGAGRPFDNR